MSEDTTEQQFPENEILRAIADLSRKIGGIENQLEIVRQGIAHTHARLDQIESISLDAKSIALQSRSQLTILTEEIRQMRKEPVL